MIYTSVDEPFATPVLAEFERRSGVVVEAAYDSEAGKTSGFLRRMRREADAPRCDVWWSSEAFGTLELARDEILAAYSSPAAADIPAEWRAADQRWTAHAARPRVLAYNPTRVAAQDLPVNWSDCAASHWRNRLAIANPQFGTTRGHVAALFAYLGRETATGLLQALQRNQVRIADGNSHAARMAAFGEVELAWTDLDDVLAMQRNGSNVRYVIPQLSPDLEALWIPCTVGLVRGSPHPDAGRKLIDYLLSSDVEEGLFRSDSHNIPVRPALRVRLGITDLTPIAPDFPRITAALEPAGQATRDILLR